MKNKIICIIVLMVSFTLSFFIMNYLKENNHKSNNPKINKTKDVVEKYSRYVTVTKETELYKKEDCMC